MELKYALSIGSDKKNNDMSRLDYSFETINSLPFSPEWFFHANLQIILENENVLSCLKAAVPKLKNPAFFF